MQIWLTKDEHMNPQILSPNHERGYYIVWDSNTWRKDRVSDSPGDVLARRRKDAPANLDFFL